MSTIQALPDLKWDEHGLIPAIVQDANSKEVLMLAYMNETSLKRTLELRETWFWSRSRQELWHKGATSGHTQRVKHVSYDCDADSLLIIVEPQGPACHTGEHSCFYTPIVGGEKVDVEHGFGEGDNRADSHILSILESLIATRDEQRPEGTYTTYLFEQGIDKILKKIGEETAEVIIAAKNKDNEELRNETSDLLYHLLVLLREAKLPFKSVLQVLEERHHLKESVRHDH